MRLEHLENASETLQARAFFEWLRLFSRMAVGGMIQPYEGAYGREAYVTDAHKTLFVYGWGYCDTSSRIAEAAWKEYKRDGRAAERVCVQHDDGGFHTMYRLSLDGHHAAFDPRYGYYLIERDAPDSRILDWAEVGVDANILKNREFQNRSRPFFEIFGTEWERALLLKPVYFDNQDAWEKAGSPKESVFGNSQYRMGTRFHDMDFRLLKGMEIERFWHNSARKFYVPAGKQAQRELPFLRSGRFYRVTESSLDGNWPKYDPNYKKAKPYLVKVPHGEGYSPEMEGRLTIGQAWGRVRYSPDLHESAAALDALAADSTLIHSDVAPYLRPAQIGGGGQATFDVYSPYVLVDGTLRVEFAGDGVKLEVRTLADKVASEAEPDVWSVWQTIPSLPGTPVELGRGRYNGRDVSIHGAYRFQIRITVAPNAQRPAPAGLKSLSLEAFFESGIMSMPQIFAGENAMQFRLKDASALRGPVKVTYTYETNNGTRTHAKLLAASDFHDNAARYVLQAPGLIRCKSLAISY